MAASDPVGGNKFWFNGIPYTGVAKSGTDTAGVKYWFNGVPFLILTSVVLLYLRPDADSVDGGWTNELGGTSLFASIDESSADDADYIQSSVNPVADLCKISLGNPSTGVAQPVKVRYRYKKDASPTANLTVRLLQGATQIASWTHSGISTSFVTTEQTLSSGEFTSITDFDNLYIEFTANS